MDLTRTYAIAPGVDWEPPADPFAGVTATDRRVLYIDDPCDVAFGDRTRLARCDYGMRPTPTAADSGLDAGPEAAPAGTVISTGNVSNEFRFATSLDDDHRMLECLEGHGHWTAVPQDSAEYESARLHYHAQQAQERLDQLRRR